MLGFRSIILELDQMHFERDACLYLPSNSPHRTSPFYAEVLAPELRLSDTMACKAHMTARKVLWGNGELERRHS
jgi:hypothetical protein